MLVLTKNPQILINSHLEIISFNKQAKLLFKDLTAKKLLTNSFYLKAESKKTLISFLKTKSTGEISIKENKKIYLFQIVEEFSDSSILLKIDIFPNPLPLPTESLIQFISHELKSPLTTIKLFAEILSVKLKQSKQLDPKGIDHLKKIDSKVNMAVSQINDYADLNRLEQNILKLDYESFSLKTLISKLIKNPQISHLGLQSESIPNLKIFADQNRLIQAITNLINYISEKSEADSIHIWFEVNQSTLSLLISPEIKQTINAESLVVYTPAHPQINLLLSQKIASIFAGKIQYYQSQNKQVIAQIILPTTN